MTDGFWLWFALKFVSFKKIGGGSALSNLKTPFSFATALAFHYLWLIKYSLQEQVFSTIWVVIRSQICIFDLLNTAERIFKRIQQELWFALKFVSLTY